VTLYEVRLWALQHVGHNLFRQFYKQSLLIAASRLLQAIYREQYGAASVVGRICGRLQLTVGRKFKVEAPLDDSIDTYLRLEIIDFPRARLFDRMISLDTANKFFRYLRLSILADSDLSMVSEKKRSEFEQQLLRLKEDFFNSFANLILNRVLFHLGREGTKAIEQSYEGHLIYPFPGLRMGVSVDQIARCSNLSRNFVRVPLVEVAEWQFVSTVYRDYEACSRAWLGHATEHSDSPVIPVHPWQMQNSTVVKSLIQVGMIRLSQSSVDAMPLASQRTCRIASTGFDLKLPMDVTLTGEHRLLYQMNAANAPVVSTLVRSIHGISGNNTIDFQYDLASVTHHDPHISSHLSAIIRSPTRTSVGERVVVALTLWSGPRLARSILPCASTNDGYKIFQRYCEVLLTGPVDFYARWGLAFEPHHQNVLVRVQDGMPTGVVLRDVDGTILDRTRIPTRLHQFGLKLPMENWDAMPSFNLGGRRLMHVLFFDHLPQVMHYFAQHADCTTLALSEILEEVWQRLLVSSPEWPKNIIKELQNYPRADMRILAMRLSRSTDLMFQQRPMPRSEFDEKS
jgi:siderophore synthetase component